MNPTTFFSAALLCLLSATDAGLTLEILNRGGTEENPLMLYLMGHSVTLFVIVKMLVTACAALVLAACAEHRFFCVTVQTVLYTAVGGYVGLICYEGVLLCLSA